MIFSRTASASTRRRPPTCWYSLLRPELWPTPGGATRSRRQEGIQPEARMQSWIAKGRARRRDSAGARACDARWLRVRRAGAHPHALTGQRATVRLGATDAENSLARARSLPACPGSGGTSSAKRRSGLLGMCMTLRTAPIRTRWPSGSRS